MSPVSKGKDYKNKVLGTLAAVAVIVGIGVGIKDVIPAPPAPSDGTCLVSNADDWGPTYEAGECTWGTVINRTNAAWTCNVPLSSLGPLPIRVVIDSTQQWSAAAAVNLDTGCSGDGNNDTIDLLMEIDGNGGDQGVLGDIIKFRTFNSQGPSGIQMALEGDCADPGGGHFDSWQQQSGNNNNSFIAMVNWRVGDYDGGIPTCQAAGGMFFWSDSGDVTIINGKSIGCNHGVNGNAAKVGAGSTLDGVMIRTGAATGTNCNGVVLSPPCINAQGMNISPDSVFQRWNGSSYANVPCTN